MADELRVKADKSPTFFNASLAVGLITGLCAIPWSVMMGLVPVNIIRQAKDMRLIMGSGALFGIVGGFLGKTQMEHDTKYGKKINAPTFWNKGLFLGALAGAIGGSAIDSAVFLGGITEAAIAIGAIIGGSTHKKVMESEYQRAALEQQLSKAKNVEQKTILHNEPYQGHTNSQKFENKINEERIKNHSLKR